MNGNKNILALISVLCTVIGGTWFMASRVSNAKTDIMAQNVNLKTEFVAAKTAIESRISALEARPLNRETWTDSDMYRWAIQLERENQGKVKVPEPQHREPTR
jgi:hypothetical protein